jgi:hypothetical protein
MYLTILGTATAHGQTTEDSKTMLSCFSDMFHICLPFDSLAFNTFGMPHQHAVLCLSHKCSNACINQI